MAGDKTFLQEFCKRKCDLKKLIRKAKPDDIKSIVDMSTQILQKKIPLNKRQLKLVAQNRHALRHLCHPKYSIKSKKRYLIQHGGSKKGGCSW